MIVNQAAYSITLRGVTLNYVKRRAVFLPANFAVTFGNVTLAVSRSVSFGQGSFLTRAKNVGAVYSGTPEKISDKFAYNSPPPSDFFEPVMLWSRPTEVKSTDYVFNENNKDAATKNLYNNYYNIGNNSWNDANYEEQNIGKTIPLELKRNVSDQLYKYNEYLTLDAQWVAEYNAEKILQWPYFWAREVIIRS